MCEEVQTQRSSREMLGMPVYSISEGLLLGNIKRLLISGKECRVQGFVVEKKRFSREERVLPFEAISGFGEDTVTVERQSLLERKGQSQQYLKALRAPLPILGAKVFTAGGRTLGKVEEYRFSTETGVISGLEIAGEGFFRERALLDGASVIAIAPRTIMVKDAAIETARSLESGLQNAAAKIRERAADIKTNASEAGRRLSATFNDTMSKMRQHMLEDAPPLENDLDDGETPPEEIPADSLEPAAASAEEQDG